MPRAITITAPAYWASYLVNGDASGLTEDELAKANAWLDRQDLPGGICSTASGEDGESREARFTWSFRLYAPECDCDGGEVLDYIALVPTRGELKRERKAAWHATIGARRINARARMADSLDTARELRRRDTSDDRAQAQGFINHARAWRTNRLSSYITATAAPFSPLP